MIVSGVLPQQLLPVPGCMGSRGQQAAPHRSSAASSSHTWAVWMPKIVRDDDQERKDTMRELHFTRNLVNLNCSFKRSQATTVGTMLSNMGTWNLRSQFACAFPRWLISHTSSCGASPPGTSSGVGFGTLNGLEVPPCSHACAQKTYLDGCSNICL